MRSRIGFFIALLLVSIVALPAVTSAAGIPYFGPIIPKPLSGNLTDVCPAGWGMLMTVINNIISLLLTIAIVFVAPIMIAWSGFLFVVNPVDPSGIAKAKGILLHTVVGIVIALAGWLIVNAVMVALYNKDAKGLGGVEWSDIIKSSGAECLPQKGALPGDKLSPSTDGGVGAPGVGTGPQVGTAKGPCDSGNTACSPSIIKQDAQSLGMNLTDAQANAMSCIAMTESGGNPRTPDSNTGACGTFQITNRPGNWSNPAFHRSPCSTSSSCNDAQCNLQTALIMVGQRGYQPWTGKKPDGTYWNANAVACVQKYDPNTSLRTL